MDRRGVAFIGTLLAEKGNLAEVLVNDSVCYITLIEPCNPLPSLGDSVFVKGNDVEGRLQGTIHPRTLNSGLERVPSSAALRPFRPKATINYRGIVMDCLDPHFGVYNLDNQVALFGCFALNAAMEIGSSTDLFNLHVVSVSDEYMHLISVLFGPIPQKLGVFLVFCPSYSQMLQSSLERKPEKTTNSEIKGTFLALLQAYAWFKQLHLPAKPEELLPLAASLSSPSSASCFIDHGNACTFVEKDPDADSSIFRRKIETLAQVRAQIEQMKLTLKSRAIYGCTIFDQTACLKNTLLHGTIRAKAGSGYEIISNDGVSINIAFGFPVHLSLGASTVLIADPTIVVELVPRSNFTNAWLSKSYLFVRTLQQLAPRQVAPDCIPLRLDYASLILVKKLVYSRLTGAENREGTAIEVRGEYNGKLMLSSEHRFFGLLTGEALKVSPKAITKGIIFPQDIYFPLKSTVQAEAPTSIIDLTVADLQYFGAESPLSGFCLKARIDSIQSLSVKLTCTQCDRILSADKQCYRHGNAKKFKLLAQATFKIIDRSFSSCTILVNDRAQLCRLLGWTDQNCPLDFLQISENIVLFEDDFALVKRFMDKPVHPLAESIKGTAYRSTLWLLTFGASSLRILIPRDIRLCNVRDELRTLCRIAKFNKLPS
jgi:hypothetical protein